MSTPFEQFVQARQTWDRFSENPPGVRGLLDATAALADNLSAHPALLEALIKEYTELLSLPQIFRAHARVLHKPIAEGEQLTLAFEAHQNTLADVNSLLQSLTFLPLSKRAQAYAYTFSFSGVSSKGWPVLVERLQKLESGVPTASKGLMEHVNTMKRIIVGLGEKKVLLDNASSGSIQAFSSRPDMQLHFESQIRAAIHDSMTLLANELQHAADAIDIMRSDIERDVQQLEQFERNITTTLHTLGDLKNMSAQLLMAQDDPEERINIIRYVREASRQLIENLPRAFTG